MATNFYAIIHSEDRKMNYRMHIGQTSTSAAGTGISTMSGIHFPDIDSWVKFLRHNADYIEIVDEYGNDEDIEEFITETLLNPADTSAAQIDWINNASRGGNFLYKQLEICDSPQPRSKHPKYWVDEASGKLFYGGDFS